MRIEPEERSPKIRIKDFKEVNKGYRIEEAIKEANRCKECGLCIKGCPVEVDIPGFIRAIKEEKFKKAYKIINEENILPAICGRVCPQENQCEAECILEPPINIGKLERFVADNYSVELNRIIKKNNKKVAVVGSGPAGLTASNELIKNGFDVVIFEALHKFGGVLRYGIPNFRLPDEIINREIDKLKKMGVKFKKNYLIGKTLYLEELQEKFDGIFISVGAGLPRQLNIKGENAIGVYFANEFLTRVNLMKAYRFPEYHTPIKKGKRTLIVGGGNVAVDSARVARRLGSKVSIVYRRLREDMPARNEEIKHAIEEGIDIKTLLNPLEIISNKNGKIKEILFRKMKTVGKTEDGRNAIDSTDEFIRIKTDIFIEAIGQRPNKMISNKENDLKFDRWGRIVVDNKMQTSLKKVWAAGDIVSGAATVIKAMGEAKKASASIISKIGG